MKFYFLAAIFCLLTMSCYSQSGCIKYFGPGFDNVYYPLALGGANGTYGARYGGTPTPLPLGCYPTEPTSITIRECSLRNPANDNFNLGGLLIESHLACPLDKSTYLLMLIFAALGFYFIRRKLALVAMA